MPNTVRTAVLAVLAAGLPAATTVALATPITAGAAEALRSGHASAGLVADWPAQASVLTGRLDQILRWARCPTIENNT
jgi:hypothetical protein